jgi:hypothetical protein
MIAKRLHVGEQSIYYHTRKLLIAGFLIIDRVEDTRGGIAKILKLKAPSFSVLYGKMASASMVAQAKGNSYLHPFVDNGALDCKIVIGSPDPHGPEAARSRDAAYAVDFGLFIGMFLNSRASPSVLLDTEMRDWNQNLIIIGGPVVNKAAARINGKSPVPYNQELKLFSFGKRSFSQDEIGVIVKMPNPFFKGKWILHIVGKRYSGTRAAVLAFLQEFDEITKSKQLYNGTKVSIVLGVDSDSDGVVDSVRFIDIS